jgi:hypothetical protein
MIDVKPKRRHAEHDFQETAFVFLTKARPLSAVWSVDNGYEHNDGSDRARAIMAARKRRGLLPGVTDIHQLDAGLYGCWECKDVNGYISDNQLLRREEILRNGGFWFSVRTLEQIEAALISIGRPPRARLGGLPVAVPTVSARRLAGFERRKLNDALPF